MKLISNIARVLLYLFISVFFLYPIVLVLLNSFKSKPEMWDNFFSIPNGISFDMYVHTWKSMGFSQLFFNTGRYVIAVVVIVLIISSMTAYKLSRSKGNIRKLIYVLLFIQLLVPFQTYIITMTQVAKPLGLLGNATGYVLLLAGLFVPTATFMIYKYMGNIPIELEESAKTDGASTYSIYFRIILPLLTPILVTVIVIDTIAIWNDFFVQMMMVGPNKAYRGIQLALYAEFSQQTSDWERALPGTVITLVPIFVFFLILQKKIEEGFIAGAVKG